MNYKALAKVSVVLLGGLGTPEKLDKESQIQESIESGAIREISEETTSNLSGIIGTELSLPDRANNQNADTAESEQAQFTQQELETKFSIDADKIATFLVDAGMPFIAYNVTSKDGLNYTYFETSSRYGNFSYRFALANPENFDKNFKYNLYFIVMASDENSTIKSKEYIRANTLEELTEEILEAVEPTNYL